MNSTSNGKFIEWSRHKEKLKDARWAMFIKVNIVWALLTVAFTFVDQYTHKKLLAQESIRAHNEGWAQGSKQAHNELYRLMPEYVFWLENDGRHQVD